MAKRVLIGGIAGLFLFALGSVALALSDPNAPYQPSIDHFRCYKVKDLSDPAMADKLVTLSDLTTDPNVTVKKKMKWACAPTEKNGEPLINPLEWLCGYKIKGPKILTPPVQVLTNQFQLPATVEIKKSDILLVPCADPNNVP